MALTKKQQEKVLVAVDQLDHENDGHWNPDGSPAVAVVAELSGLKGLTGDDISFVAPDFKRAPQEDAPQEDAPQEDAPQEDAPQEDAPQEDAPQEDAPQEDAPQEDAPQEDAPQEDAPRTPIQEAEQALANANKKLDDAVSAFNKARENQVLAQNEVARAQRRLDKLTVKHHDRSAETVAGYLASQSKLRDEMARRYQELQGAGELVKPRSQLDEAMARTTGYGHGRPAMPLIK